MLLLSCCCCRAVVAAAVVGVAVGASDIQLSILVLLSFCFF